MRAALNWSTAPPFIAHRLSFQGKVFCTSWAVLRERPAATGRAGQEAAIECFQRASNVPAIGIKAYRKRSLHRFTADGRPKESFVEDSYGNALRVRFKGDALDFGPFERPLDEPVDFISEPNMYPLMAYQLLVRLINSAHRFVAFIPDSASTVPLTITSSDGTVASSFGEAFEMDEDGVIDGISFDTPDFAGQRIFRQPPHWPSPLAQPRFQYRPPGGIETVEASLVDGELAVDATVARPRKPIAEKAVGVFIGGTGHYNRHGFTTRIDIGYHQVLDDLAGHGISSVRFEKQPRRIGGTGGAEEAPDFETLCRGAENWLHWLDHQDWAEGVPRVVFGHSLGGLVALETAHRHESIAATVVLSTPARSMRALTEKQFSWFAGQFDVSDATKAEMRDLRAAFLSALDSDVEWEEGSVPAKLLPLKGQRRLMKSILDIDPCRLAAQSPSPLLIVHGGKDVQVPPSDAQALAAAARAAGRQVHLIEEPQLDHVLKRNTKTGLQALSAYADRRRRVPIALIRKIAKAIETFIN